MEVNVFDRILGSHILKDSWKALMQCQKTERGILALEYAMNKKLYHVKPPTFQGVDVV